MTSVEVMFGLFKGAVQFSGDERGTQGAIGLSELAEMFVGWQGAGSVVHSQTFIVRQAGPSPPVLGPLWALVCTGGGWGSWCACSSFRGDGPLGGVPPLNGHAFDPLVAHFLNARHVNIHHILNAIGSPCSSAPSRSSPKRGGSMPAVSKVPDSTTHLSDLRLKVLSLGAVDGM